MIGGVMVAAGIIGALVLPALSDRRRRRTPYLVVGMAGACLGLAGLTFAPGFAGVMVASLVLGFFLLGAAPVGFQYGAEATLPAPEATSNGLLLMMGQFSGIVFILAMDAFRSVRDRLDDAFAGGADGADGGQLRAVSWPEGGRPRAARQGLAASLDPRQHRVFFVEVGVPRLIRTVGARIIRAPTHVTL